LIPTIYIWSFCYC